MANRIERVTLELEDNFTSGMARAAAATALFDKTLAELDGSSTRANKSTTDLGGDNGGIAKTGRQARNASNDLNKYTGRLNLLLTAAATLGPSLIPISAGLIPAMAGLAAGFGAAAGAAGVAALAFNGVGDAIKAVDAYKLAPTAENLQKMNQALHDLGPAGAEFATFIDGLEPELRALQNTARAGLFPGLEQGINELLPMLPQVQQLVASISTELGHLSEEAGNGLANDASFQRFFHYMETDAAPTMDAFAKATGHVASGLASLMVDLAPLTRDFSGGLEHAARSFDDWAAGLNQTQGFRDFLAYVEQQGPKVVDLLEALGNASLGIIHAMQPVGAVVLPTLTALANIIGAIGNSPIGPVFYTAVAGMLVFNRMAALSTTALEKLAGGWALVTKSAVEASAAQEAAAGAGLAGGAAGAAGALPTAEKAAGTAARAGSATKITGLGSLLAASPLLRGAGSKVIAGAGTVGTTTLIAALASELAGVGGSTLSDKLFPGQGTLGSANNIQDITSSLQHGWQSKFTNPVGSLAGIFGLHAWSPDNLENKKPVQSADIGLASMVGAGQAKQAADIFDEVTAAAKKQGVAVDDVKAKFPNYTAAVAAAAAANKDDSASTDVSTMSMKQLRQAVVDGTIGLKQYAEAQEALHQRALSNFDAVTSFGQAVQNAAKQAASGAKGFNQFTAAGAANRQAISGLVEAYNAQPKAVKNSVKGYEQMHGKLVQLMTQMGATKSQIDAFTKDIDKPRKLVLGFQDKEALDAIARVKAEMAGLKDKTVKLNYYVNQINGSNKPKVLPPDALHKADGGLIGPMPRRSSIMPRRFASGGHALGRPIDAYDNEITTHNHKKPLFTREGPHWYAAAYRHNAPFAKKGPARWDWPYQTGLTRAQEDAFERWVFSKRVPFDPGDRITDYDMRGYWARTHGKGWHQGSHFPDTFKTPYDTTFSHESRYATKNNPFFWHGNKLIDQRNGQVVFAAGGGQISGPGGPRDDLIPAYLSNGEFVVNAATTQRLLPWLEQENAKGYATGGLVGGPFDGYSIDSTTVTPGKTSAAATKAAQKKAAADAKAAAAAQKAARDLGMLSITLKPLNGKDFKDLRAGLHGLLDESKKNRDILRLTGTSLKDLNKASHLLGKSLTSTKSALSTMQSNRDSLQSSITSGLMPDLFSSGTTSTNPFTPGATRAGFSPDSINAQIGSLRSKADQFGTLLTAAEAKGLKGDALNVVLSQGGFDALQMYANAPASTVQSFVTGYTGLEKAVNADAVAGGKAVYGADLDKLHKQVHTLNQNVKAVEKAIKDKTKLDDRSRAKHSKQNSADTTAGVKGAAVKGAKSNPHRGRK